MTNSSNMFLSSLPDLPYGSRVVITKAISFVTKLIGN